MKFEEKDLSNETNPNILQHTVLKMFQQQKKTL